MHTIGDLPLPRRQFSLNWCAENSESGNTMAVVFGGQGSGGQFFNDLFVLDVSSKHEDDFSQYYVTKSSNPTTDAKKVRKLLSKIDDETYLTIFSFGNGSDLESWSQVCSRWKRITNAQGLFLNFLF